LLPKELSWSFRRRFGVTSSEVLCQAFLQESGVSLGNGEIPYRWYSPRSGQRPPEQVKLLCRRYSPDEKKKGTLEREKIPFIFFGDFLFGIVL